MKVKCFIDYDECAKKIQYVLPQFSVEEIELGFQSYHRDSSDYEEVCYTHEQVEAFIAEKMAEFVAEQTGESRFSSQTALALEMPLQRANIHPHNLIGGWL